MKNWRSIVLGGTLAVVATGAIVAASLSDGGLGTAGPLAQGGGVPDAVVPGGGVNGAMPGGGATVPVLGAAELPLSSRSDGEPAPQSRSITATAVQGSLNDFWNATVLKLDDGVWLLDRQMNISLIVEQEPGRLIAIHSDGREPSEAIIRAGSPDEFLSFGGPLEARGGDSDLDAESLCGGVLPCQGLSSHTWWCTCMSRCDCGTEPGSVCCFHVVDQPENNKFECSYRCCDDDDTGTSQQQAGVVGIVGVVDASNPCPEHTPE